MIGLSTKLFNLDGHWVLNPKLNSTDYRKIERRVSRSATLDGGASIIDQGYSDGDRTFKFDFVDLSPDIVSSIESAIKVYSEFLLCSDVGAFFVTPSLFDYRNNTLTLNLLVSGTA